MLAWIVDSSLGPRREFSSPLGQVYVLFHKFPERGRIRIPPRDVRQELGLAVFHLFLAVADLRVGAQAPLVAHEGRQLPNMFAEAAGGASWSSDPTVNCRESAHVNIPECRVVKVVVKKFAQDNPAPARVVVGTDSQVVIGAWRKGRSSSSRLNALLRS